MKFTLGVLFLACAGLAAAQQQQASPIGGVIIHPQAGTRIKVDDKITAAKIITKIQPVYPPLARQTRISGTVKLHAIIDRDGSVQKLDVISGHPLLVQSALDAVRQWKYQPTLLNGEPVEVETTIDVVYQLAENNPQEAALRAGSAPAIDPQLRADLTRLLELTSTTERSAAAARKAMEGMRATMFRNVGDEAQRQKIIDSYEDKVVAIFKSEIFRESTINTYAKYFDDQDAKAMIAFYQTPTGHKFNDLMPQFTSDMMELGQRLAVERIPDIFRELCQENPILAAKLPDCATPDGEKKSRLTMPLETLAQASGQ